jgi:hypothetical protein
MAQNTAQNTAQNMARYAVLIFERETPGGVADIPPEVMRAHEDLPRRIREHGGREIAGLALEPTATATSIRGDLVTDGPFVETKEALAGVFIIEARDLDHAVELARMTPIVSGGVEVRPLLGFEVTADGATGGTGETGGTGSTGAAEDR